MGAEVSALRLARFCLASGVSPSEARNLTIYEYNAFIDALGEMNNG